VVPEGGAKLPEWIGLETQELSVILDLVRAFPAALLVGVVPGWFWAGCLCASADRAERLAYSVAFSTTLVPTAALVQARLFGVGVTPAITIVSVLLVLGMGLIAYLKFGPAKGLDEPLVSHPVSLGLPTLIPLIVASALMLGARFGAALGERVAPLVALSVLAAGIAHLLASRGAPPLSRPREEVAESQESLVVLAARWLLLSAVLLLVLLRSYPGPLRYDWPFPRGVDKYEHAVMVSMMLSEGTTESFMLYPPGFHALAAGISGLSGLEPLKLFAILAPALLVLPALACYALARRLWGWEVGVAAALFSGLIAGGSYQHVSHARYPNVLGVFLLVLAVAALVRLYASSSVRDQLTLAILGSSVVFYHQVASMYLAVLLAVVGLFFLPYLLLRHRKEGLALLSSLVLLGLFSILYAWDTYDLPRLVAGLLSGTSDKTGRGGEAVAMAIGTKPTYDLGHLLTTTSQPALWFGLLGALVVVGELVRRDRISVAQRLAYLSVLLWALLLFAGSRTSLSGFPDRFERDLGIPLAVLAALAFVALLRSPVARGPVMIFAAFLAVTVVGVQAAGNLEEGFGPAQRWIDRPPPPKVAAAGGWLEEHNEGGSILSTPSVGPVSARGMLAMGGYSGMQTYSVHRIQRGRDLPPFGAGPLWDALWALRHPEGERTRRILEDHDVRYVVLGKHRSDDIDWRSFQDRTDLYRMVFENENVVIFELREGQ
jgi:hypothetical protein